MATPVFAFSPRSARITSELLGQKVKVLFKDGKDNQVIGVVALADNQVINRYRRRGFQGRRQDQDQRHQVLAGRAVRMLMKFRYM